MLLGKTQEESYVCLEGQEVLKSRLTDKFLGYL